MYIYGYKICKLFYSSNGLLGIERKLAIKNYWELRFSIYSLIIMIVFYISTKTLNKFNTMLVMIGFSLAFYSSVDKLILNDYDFSKYDKLIVFFIISSNFLIYKYKNR